MSAFLVAWTNWVHDPVIAVALLVLAALYVEGFARADPRIVAPARTVPRIGAFIAGLLTATLAMVSPLDTPGGQFFAAHMLQHLVLIMVVAPLLAWSRADVILSHSLPVSARRWLARYRAISGVKTWTNGPRTAWLVAAVFTGTIWLWHIPAAHDAALGNAGLHVLEFEDGKGNTQRCVALVEVAADGPAAASEPSAADTQAIARRYREEPSPLVRDTRRGWRSGRLDRVLGGDFDIMQ